MDFLLMLMLMLSVLLAALDKSQASFLKLSQAKCESPTDKLRFEYCDIKAVKRDFNYLRLKADFEPISPMRNLTLQLQLMKRENGWKPYLYSVRTDLCEFLRKPNHPIVKIFMNFIRGHINRKLKCPFESPVLLDNVSNVHIKNQLNGLPLPSGDYAFFTNWYVTGINVAKVKVHVTITN